MKTIFARWMVGLAAVLAAGTARATVSVDEIIRLHSAGLSDQSLLLVVSASDTPDTLSTAQLTQLIEAQVPDTVISQLVSKADAVMEDWQPVNVDSVMNARQTLTETEVYNVYPGYVGWWDWPSYGWCGTPYYGYYPWYGYAYPAPYSGFYVGVGWGGGWSFGFGWGGGYCGWYDPWYWGGGYCGWYDPWYGYDPYPGYGYNPYYSYREIDRVDYHNGAQRGSQRGVSPTPHRQETGGSTETSLSRMEGKNLTSVDRGSKTYDGKSLRGGTETAPATRSIDQLKSVSSQRTGKSTLTGADRGDGRYVIKGDDKVVRDAGNSSGKTLETLGDKFNRSGALKPEAPAVRSEVQSGLDRSSGKNGSDLAGRVSQATRNLSGKATAATETTGQKVNRYIQMKNAQRADGGSRAGRSTSSNSRFASAAGAGKSPAASGGQVQRQGNSATQPPKAATGTRNSAPQQVSRPGSGQRSTPSFGTPSRSGGSPSGGMSRGGGGGARSGGGGGARSGGGGSRGGGRR